MTVRITNQTLHEAADVLGALGAGLAVARRQQIAAMQTLLAFTSVLRPEDPIAADDLQDAATGLIFGEIPSTPQARRRALKRCARVRAAAAEAIYDILIEEDA